MIQIEYLITGLRIDVIEHKSFTDVQKKELIEILDTCPTIPMSINPIKLYSKGKQVEAHLNIFETKYLSYGGSLDALKAIRDDYSKQLTNALKGFRQMRR